MKTYKAIVGMAVAAAAGAAIGMLLAPEKGRDLQRKIKDGAQQWLNEVSRLVNTGRQMVESAKTEAEREIHMTKSNLSRIED